MGIAYFKLAKVDKIVFIGRSGVLVSVLSFTKFEKNFHWQEKVIVWPLQWNLNNK